MPKTVKIVTLFAGLVLLSACASPYQGYNAQGYGQNQQAQGRYIRIPPAQPQQRRVIVRTETHRVLTPQVIMEPCCNMQPDVIYMRRY